MNTQKYKFRLKLFTLLCLQTCSVMAISITIEHPCDFSRSVYSEARPQSGGNLGTLTIEALKRSNVSYEGSKKSIISIFDTPVGSEALKVISENEMLSYGWCYCLDGEELDRMPGDVYINQGHKDLFWFYGYARYLNGEWMEYCVPAEESSLNFCQN